MLGLDNRDADFYERFSRQVHPDDREAFFHSIAEAAKASAKWQFEGRYVKPSGEMIWFRGVSSPERHGDELVYSGVLLDISQMKITEAALHEEEAKYRTFIELSQDAVFIVQDGVLVFANKALSDMAGYADAELTGRPIAELIAPEDRETVVARNRDRIAGKPVVDSYEFSILHKDQKTRIRVKMNAGLARFGGRAASIGTFHNVTVDREREEALQKSEQKYRELAELLPQMVFEMDACMRITYANRHALEAFGGTPDDMENGIEVLDYIDPSQHTLIEKNVRKMIAGEPYDNPEYTAIRKDGTRFPVIIYNSPIYQDGKLTGFRGIMVDISDWKAAAAARAESEERYQTLAEAAQDLIYIIDRNDVVTYVNSYGLQMIGKSGNDVLGKPRSAVFAGAEGAKQYQSLQRVFTTGMPVRVEGTVHLSGRETWQDTHLVPLKTADGTITAVLGISRDISRLKQAQNALKRSNAKLNLLNSITRHDVANQLTTLNGYIQLAMIKEPDMVIADFLKKIETASDTIQHQIEFTRMYQDLGIQAPGWFRLMTIIEKTRPDGVDFTSLCNDIEIFADPMLEKVFFNLFDNAVRHGGRVTSMIVRCEPHGDELVITVEDNGVGIPLSDKQKIFQKGFGKNTGYGLFLVREILAITGMDIHETGRHGSGARFEITVPKSGFRQVAPE
jgi:PAS domain S-box-containing protein